MPSTTHKPTVYDDERYNSGMSSGIFIVESNGSLRPASTFDQELTETTSVTLTTSNRYRWLAFTTVAVGQFTTVIGNSGTAVALPRIADDLELDLAVASWVMVAMALTISAVLLPMGRLSDVMGRKRVYIAGLLVMASGVTVSATSQNLPILLIGRVIEGFGAAMVMTVAIAIITSVFPASERGKALGMNMFVIGLGAVSGPVVGGVLVDVFSWRAIFMATGVVTIFGSGLAIIVLNEAKVRGDTPKAQGSLDWPGIFTSSAGLAILILSLTNGNRFGWDSPYVIGGFVAFVLLLAWFLRWEARAVSPMIDLTIFRVSQFSWAVSGRFFGFLMNGPTNFLMPFYLQEVTGRSASQAGLVSTPLPIMMAIIGALAGRWSDRFGFRNFMLVGLGLQLGTLAIFSTFNHSTPLAVILLTMFVHGVGSGLWMAPNMSAAVGAVSRSAYGVAAAFLNLVRNTANVTAIAVAAAIVAGVMISRGVSADLDAVSEDPSGPAGDAFVSGMHIVFRILIASGVMAMFAAIMAQRKRSQTEKTQDALASVRKSD
jgi:EmrB/QacA subfamily drug resistance transporter